LKTLNHIFLEQLITELKKEKVEAIDTQKVFEDVYRRDRVLLYKTDDTHWNANEVKLTAKLIQESIEKKMKSLVAKERWF